MIQKNSGKCKGAYDDTSIGSDDQGPALLLYVRYNALKNVPPAPLSYIYYHSLQLLQFQAK